MLFLPCSYISHQPSDVSLLRSSVLTALPALAVAPQPIQAKVEVASSSAALVTELEVSSVGCGAPALNNGLKNTWVHLEELANTLLNNVQQLKALIEQARNAAEESTRVRGQGGRKEVRQRAIISPAQSLA